MKNIILLIVAFSTITFWGCDKIEGEYRENANELLSTVTLFDFTGITCVNCPDAHDEIEKLKKDFGHNLQAIAVHGDQNFAGPINGWFLYNQIGQKLTDQTKVSGLPQGSINSLEQDDFSAYTEWSSAIAKVGYTAPDLILNAEFSIEESDTSANVIITGAFEEYLSKDYNELHIGVYLLESHIIGPQYRIGVGTIPDYEHNHVLRESFHNGEISETFLSNPSAGMEIDQMSFSIKINEKWNLENLEVVVFVMEKETMHFIPIMVNYI